MSPDDDAADRRARVVLAGHRGDASTVSGALGDPAPVVRSAALGGAARLGLLDPLTLRDGLEDAHPDVRSRACRLAAALPGPLGPALQSLVDRLDDPDDRVTEVACFACGERADLDARGVDRLVELSGDHTDALVRESAVAALGSLAGLGVVDRIGRTDSVRAAVVAAGSDVAPVRRRVAVATAAFDGPEVERLLDRLLTDRDQQARQIAEDLRAISGGTASGPEEQPVAWVDRRRDPTD